MSLIDPTSLYFSAAAEAAAQTRKKETEAKKTERRQKFSAMLKASFDAGEESTKISRTSEIDNLPYEEAISRLKEMVNSAGDALRKNQMPEEMQNYKEAVRQFVDYVVKNSYEVETYKRRLTLTKDRIICRIKIIDKKLENLASELLLSQHDQIAFLAKVDELNGLVVDLLS